MNINNSQTKQSLSNVHLIKNLYKFVSTDSGTRIKTQKIPNMKVNIESFQSSISFWDQLLGLKKCRKWVENLYLISKFLK